MSIWKAFFWERNYAFTRLTRGCVFVGYVHKLEGKGYIAIFVTSSQNIRWLNATIVSIKTLCKMKGLSP